MTHFVDPAIRPGAARRRLPLSQTLIVATALFTGCGSLPKRPPEKPAVAESTDATFLGRALAPVRAEHPGLSGVYPLDHGIDAFTARVALARMAERSLDVQYYIWHSDNSGKLLADELIQAADRGVHVRVLLDDFHSGPEDEHLLALNGHTNIEVRLFNPVVNREFGQLALLFQFNRINRRMHNKSFTIDNQATIIGGRNVGDEYFEAGEGVEFADFDVLAVGPVVKEASQAFDLYWRSPSSIPITSLTHKNVSAEWSAREAEKLAAHREAMRDSDYIRAVRDSRLMSEIQEREVPFSWGHAWLAYDLPDKITATNEDRSRYVTSQLRPVVAATQHEVLIVSPYFVPGETGVRFFQGLVKRGVRVIILTNSLEATDVAAVHAGYRRYRKALLRAGVELYEFKSALPPKEVSKHEKLPGSSAGSSRASLHAKTFVFDGRTAFVGSLNLDPRSTSINTESGLVIEVPEIAAHTAEAVARIIRHHSYRLEFIPGPGPCKECGTVNWVTEEDGETVRYCREPGAGPGRRLLVGFLSFLPIEGQL